MINIWITGSKAPILVSRIPAMGQPVNPWPDSFFVAGNPPKRISPAYRSNTYALAALAVGGKLTKRVPGSFECREARRVLRGAFGGESRLATSHAVYSRWQMTGALTGS